MVLLDYLNYFLFCWFNKSFNSQHQNSFWCFPSWCLPPAGSPWAVRRAARHSELRRRPAAAVHCRRGRPGKRANTQTQTVWAGGRAAGGGVGRRRRRRLDSRFVWVQVSELLMGVAGFQNMSSMESRTSFFWSAQVIEIIFKAAHRRGFLWWLLAAF